MRVDRLSLRSFRNYEEGEIAFAPGINLILGMNAQGKTNLLEAITYLSAGHAFRTRKEKDLISFGADFADLTTSVFTHERQMELRAVLFAARRPRQLFLNGVKQRTFGENMAGQLMSVLFCPIIAPLSGVAQMQAVYGAIVGSNLGAFLTPIGALAGIMWMSMLKKHGVKFSYLSFVKYCALVAVIALVTCLGVLYFIV